MITFNLTAYGETLKVTPHFSTYTNLRVHLTLLYWDTEFEAWFPHCTLSTNLPDQHLNPDEFFIKDWSENEPIVAELVERGMLIPTGREVISGFVAPQVMKLGGDLDLACREHFSI